MLRFRSILLTALATASLTMVGFHAPSSALADNPTVGQVFAVGDHVLPGETLTILGGQLEPSEELVVRLTTTSGVIELGRVVVATDGTIELSAPIAVDTPLGPATITATDRAGTVWTSNALIGERAEGPGAQQPVVDDGILRNLAWFVLAVGVLIFLAAGARYLRR